MFHLSKTHLLPLVAATMLASTGLAMAKTVTLTGNFTTEGKATSQPSGMVEATLNTSTNMLHYSISYAGLSGPVGAAHFHGPATAMQNGKVLIPIPGPYTSGMSGDVKVSKAAEAILLANKTYVNLHTKAYPAGEARAQMMVSK